MLSASEPNKTSNLSFLQQLELNYAGNWVTRTINSYMDIKKNIHSLKELSESLGFKINEVVHSIETLETLGIIRKTELGYRKVLKYIFYPHQSKDSRRAAKDHMLISMQILNRIGQKEKQKTFYRSSFVATNKQLTKELSENLDILLKNFLMASEKSEKDSVLALSITGVEAFSESPTSEVSNEAI